MNLASEAALAQSLLTDPNEIAELQKFVDRGTAIEPYTIPLTVGVTPADVPEIVESHMRGGVPVERLVRQDG